MIIRYRLHPRPPKITLIQDKVNQQQEQQQVDYSYYLTRTLNPETPHKDILAGANRNHKQNELFKRQTTQFSFKNLQFLQKEKPITFDQTHQETIFNQVQGGTQQQINIKVPKIKFDFTQIPENTDSTVLPYYKTIHSRTTKQKPIFSERKESYSNRYACLQKDPPIIKQHQINSKLHKTLQKLKSISLNCRDSLSTPIDSQEDQPIRTITGINNTMYTYNFNTIQNEIQTAKTTQPDFTKNIMISHARKQLQKHKYTIKRKIMPPQNKDDEQDQPVVLTQKAATQAARSQISNHFSSRNTKKSNSIRINAVNKTRKGTHSMIKPLIVSFKTSLLQLKQICTRKDLEQFDINIQLPERLSKPYFQSSDSQESLFIKAGKLFCELGIQNTDEALIRRYQNCVTLICKDTSIVSHFSGKFYVGGWSEDNRNGLGLDYVPKKFVYFGEFSEGKRHGFGILKGSNNQIFAGVWKTNKFTQGKSYKMNFFQNESNF